MFKKLIKKLMNYLSKLSVEQEDVVGVDITPGCIRLAQLSGDDDKWTLSKLSYKYIENAVNIESIKNKSDQYVNKLSQIISQGKITTTNAAVSIPVSSAIIKVVSLPLMTDEELQEAVDTNTLWENVVQLTDNLDEYSIFWQVLKRNTSENQMDLLFVASKLDDIDHYLNIVRQAGLNPVVVDVRCFAIRNALELRKDLTKDNAPVAIVEFGVSENYILILHEDSPFISDIYLSDKDRNLLSNPDIDPILHKKIIDRFAMQVGQMLSSYQSKYKIQPIDSLLISSTFSTLDGTLTCFKEALPNIEVEIFNALEKIILPENLKEKALAEQNSSVFSSVLGLATRKLDVFGYYEYVTGTNNINLLPNRDGVKNQEKMKFLSRWGIVIFTILILLFAGWSFFSDSSKLERVDNLMIEYNNLEMLKNDKRLILDDIKIKQKSLSGMLEVSKTLTSNQEFMYSVLLAINTSVPQSVSLNRISYSGGNIMTLTGLSVSDQNILQFIANLQNTKTIDKASLLTMSVIKKEKRSLKSFSIRCVLAPQESVLIKEKSNGN
ncbi:MAG: pilus assembly protein PilM [Gammaproteobacteria bacterium]|nr:pilus assembly protein PilM [Gammaproteobacteria bacterium]